MPILLKNTVFIHWETLEMSPETIFIEEGKGGKVFWGQEALNKAAHSPCHVIDCSGKFVTKSFVNAHHHAYSALARGMPAPAKQAQNFTQILEYIWWNLDKCLDEQLIEYSALATALACAKAGVTFVIDHHASPFCVSGSLEIIADAFDKVGVAHLLCYEISDRDGLDIAKKGLLETESYLAKNQGLVGLHASFTVSNETLLHAAALVEKWDAGIHVHVAEDMADQENCLKQHGMRVIERLEKSGILDVPKSILAHCIHIDDNEREIIRNSKAWVVQNMESNLNNRVGVFSGKGLGERLLFGTDGMHSDMLQSAKAAFFAGQKTDVIDYPSAYRRFRNAHRYLAENHFDGDGENNFVVLDYDSPTPLHTNNFLGHFLFGLNQRHITHVISSGKLIVADRKICTVDEVEILRKATEQAERLWKKMQH